VCPDDHLGRLRPFANRSLLSTIENTDFRAPFAINSLYRCTGLLKIVRNYSRASCATADLVKQELGPSDRRFAVEIIVSGHPRTRIEDAKPADRRRVIQMTSVYTAAGRPVTLALQIGSRSANPCS
jgi:hypothetical protein